MGDLFLDKVNRKETLLANFYASPSICINYFLHLSHEFATSLLFVIEKCRLNRMSFVISSLCVDITPQETYLYYANNITNN